MNSSQNSPRTRTRKPLRTVFAGSRVRPVALFILLATLATAGFAATSSAGALRRIVFGNSSISAAPAVTKGVGLRASASGAQLQDAANAAAALNSSAGPARRGHTATLLDSGGVLVVGGDDAGTAVVFDAATATHSVTGGLSVPRFEHTATKLADGRVLVIGGRSGGTSFATSELYNTTTGSFEAGPSMGVARAGHSATLLSDGKILVAGGDEAGSAEVYDPASNSFSAAGAALGVARSAHAAALLKDGRVLVVGGRDAGGNELESAEIYDGSGFGATGNAMAHHRVRAHLRVLPDGKVQVIGGNDDDSMEVYDPDINLFGAHGHLIPITDPDAALLEDDILGAETRAAFFHHGQTDAVRDREGHTLTEIPQLNKALLFGGANSAGNPLNTATVFGSSPATVTTDKLDYRPGQTATISGAGWQPGEYVNIILHEDPHTHTERRLRPQADAEGKFTITYLVEEHDLDVTFIVGAKGESSLRTAQTTFTDAAGWTLSITPTSVAASSTTAFTLTPRSTSTTSNPADRIFCVTVTIPSQFTPVGSPSFVGGDRTWSVSRSGQVITAIPSGSNQELRSNEQIQFSQSATAPASTTGSPFTWTGTARTTNCSGTQFPTPTGGQPTVAVTNAAAPTTLAVNSATGTYGGTVNLSATLNQTSGGAPVSGKTISFSLNGTTVGTATTNASGVATLSNASLSGINAGTYVNGVAASFAGDAGFAASSGSNSLTVTPKSVTPSVTANNKTYDATTTATLSSQTLSGVFPADTANVSLSVGAATFSDKNVGNGKTVTATGLTLTGSAAGNYQLSSTTATTTADITAATLTGSFTANDKTYDATTAATIATRSLSGVIGGDNVSLVGGSATFDTKNVGTDKTVTGTGFTLSGGDAGNYVLASTTLTATADITPASLTGSFTAASRTYDGTATASITGRSLAGVIGGDDVSLSGGAATFSDKNVGSGKVVTGTGFTLAGTDAGNYALASTTLTTNADITALHITGSFTAGDKTYDGTTAANVLTRSLTGAIGGDDVSLAGGTATFADKHAGNGKTVTLTGASLAGADAGNYVLDSVSAATANITPRALTVSATGVSRVYDGTANATVTLSDDRVSGDTLTANYTSASFADKNVGTGKAVSVLGISISGADAANYALANTTANATADITQRSLTVTATGVNREYDGTTAATVTLSDDRIGGDVLGASYASASFADKNVGAAKTISVSGISISGTDAVNYSLSNTTASAAADITAKALTVSATGINKTYDGTTNATVTLSSTGVVSGDNVSTSYTGATFADKNVGNGKTVSVSGISLGGADAGNYTSNSTASATADITPLTITGSFTAANKTYDGTTAATISTRSVSGEISGDSVTLTGGTATFADKNVGMGKAVTGTGFTLAGADAGNYALASATLNANADITPRALTVSATGVNKVYDGTTAATVTLSDDRVSGDDLTVDYAGASFADPNVGAGKPVSVSGICLNGADAGNYTFNTTASTSADITPRSIAVTADPQTKVYGDADPALTYQITSGSLVSGDMFSGGLSRVAGVDVGTYAIQQGTLALSSNYELTFVGANLTITARAITVTADAQAKTYGDGDPGLTYQLTSGSLVGTDAFTGALARDAGENVGAYAIQQGTLALSSNYVLTFVGNNLTINARAITVTADAKAKVYGDGDPALTYQITSGSLAFSDTFNGALSRAVGENVGAYAIGQGTLALDANYVLSFVGADLTITARPVEVTANAGQMKVYGGADPAAFTYSVTSGSLAFSDAFTGALTRDAGENVGSYAILQGTLSLGGNYNLTYVGANFAITKATLTITAQPNTKTYDGTDSAAAVPTVAGLQFSDTVTGLVEVYDNRNAGTGKTLSVTAYTVNDGNSGNNYAVTTVADTTGVINNAALTITAQPNTKTYDGNKSAAATPSVSGLQGSDTVTGLAEVYDNRNAGTGKTLSVSAYTVNDGNGGNNYTVSTVNDTTGVINKAPLTITAQPNTKTYDGTDSAAAAPVVVGAQDSDTVTGLAEAYDTKHVGTGKTLSVTAYTVNDGNSGNNYTVSTVNSTAGVINKRAITVTATASTKIYDGTTASSGTPTVTSGSIAGGDTGNFTQTFDNPLVGTGKTLTPAGSVSDGNAGNNYQITFVPVTTGTITTSYCFNGFLSPIGGSVETLNGGSFADPVRAFKLGSTIPVKFALSSWNGTACGNVVTTGIHTLQAVKYNNAVDAETPIDASPTDAATSGNQFRLTDSQWHFNLSTKAGFSQGTWLLKATLQDGSIHTVWVTIKK